MFLESMPYASPLVVSPAGTQLPVQLVQASPTLSCIHCSEYDPAPPWPAGVILSVWNPTKSWERDPMVRVNATMGVPTKVSAVQGGRCRLADIPEDCHSHQLEFWLSTATWSQIKLAVWWNEFAVSAPIALAWFAMILGWSGQWKSIPS